MNKLLLALLTSVFFGGAALAASATSFETLDQDGNGSISAQEAEGAPALKDAWQSVDANQDGMVDKAEFSAFEAMEPKKEQ